MNKHILIVDDEASVRDLLERFLTGAGFRVTAVATAAEAIRSVREDPPQLIISDLQLEDSDGLEMIAKLKATLPATPVMLLTGVLFDSRVVQEVLSGKVSSYIEKTSSLARILEEAKRLTQT